ncbi:MAG: hypothetical protein AAF602_16485, partial [Myxococcota bacterium]
MSLDAIAALLRRLRDDPEDRDAWRVLKDALEERGDPRSARVADDLERDPELARLEPFARVPSTRLAPSEGTSSDAWSRELGLPDGVEARFRNGFVYELRVPWSAPDAWGCLSATLDHPLGAMLRSVRMLGTTPSGEAGEDLVRRLLRTPGLERLVGIAIEHPLSMEKVRILVTELPDTHRLLSLARCRLTDAHLQVIAWLRSSSPIEHLGLSSNRLSERGLEELARWSALRDLWVTNNPGMRIDGDWSSAVIPKLRRLHVAGCAMDDRGALTLLRHGSHLEALSLGPVRLPEDAFGPPDKAWRILSLAGEVRGLGRLAESPHVQELRKLEV